MIQEEIGVHIALVHCREAVWNWNKPVPIGKGKWRCKGCKDDITDMDVDDYLIHTTFAHDTLEKLSNKNDFNILEGIRRALKEKTESEEREMQRKHRYGNRATKRPRSSSRGTEVLDEHNHPVNETSQDERKMLQKLSSYNPLMNKEVQVLKRDIPLRKSTPEEKDDMTKAAKKVLTKLHLIYTMGIDAVPKKYTFTRNSMTTNFNHLYDENNTEREENMRRK